MDYIFPILVVILIIFAAYITTKWVAKRQNSYTSGKVIKVLERVTLGKDVYIAVVQVDEKLFLLSISSGKTELLTELPPETLEKYTAAGQNMPDFMRILKSVMGGKNSNGDSAGKD